MVVNEVIAKYKAVEPNQRRGINIYHMKKTELVRLIQTKEGNSPCFKGDYAQSCGQTDCLWFTDCKNNRK